MFCIVHIAIVDHILQKCKAGIYDSLGDWLVGFVPENSGGNYFQFWGYCNETVQINLTSRADVPNKFKSLGSQSVEF